MKVYEVSCSDYYESYNILDSNYDLICDFKSTKRMKEEWGVKKLVKNHEGKKADIAYNWSFPGSMILNEHAYNSLKDVFVKDTEFLPVVCNNELLYIPHIVSAIENIQVETVKVKFNFYDVYREDDVIREGLNDKYYFRVDLGNNVFTNMLFTQKFIDLIQEYGLKGIKFDEVGGTKQKEE